MNNEHKLNSIEWNLVKTCNYKGVLITKLPKGFSVFGITCNTPDEVDEIILNACSILSESLVVRDSDNCVSINTQK